MGISSAGATMSEEETRYITQKLQAQTVLIGRWVDDSRVQGRDKVRASRPGSGILVQNGEFPGILTAGHVLKGLLRNELSADEVVMAIGQGANPMSVGRQDYSMTRVQGWIVESEGMHTSHGDPLDMQLRGPDIAWIQITEEDARTLKGYSGGIFHNWQKSEEARPEETLEQGYQKEGLWMCGGIHEKSEKLLEVGHVGVCVLTEQVFRAGLVPEPEDGWDRCDYTLQLIGHSKAGHSDWGDAGRSPAEKKILREEPASWRGVSGAGIWLAHKQQVDERLQCSLVGVVYAEHPPNSNKPELKLRAHGIGSINRVLTSK